MFLYQIGKWFSAVAVVALVIALSACSQSPVSVSDYGDEFYGFGSVENSYSPPVIKSGKKNKASKKYVWVKVRRGDTLSELAEKHNVATKNMISLNKLKKPYRLNVGQLLKVGKSRYHVVGKGDTLREIAQDYGVNMSKLAKENKLRSPYIIHVDQKIYMPGVARGSSSKKLASSKSKKKWKKKNYGKSARTKKKATKSYALKKSPGKRLSGAPKFLWPVKGRVIQNFGAKKGGAYNDGINIAAPEGTNVRSSADGTVVYVGSELKAYGNLVIVKHRNGWLTAYAHNKSVLVKRGQKVKARQKIARVGVSGKVDEPQLHFAVRKGREAVNPGNYL